MTDARASEPSRPGRSRVRFAARLLVAQALVLVACALTTWLVASLVGPTIFSDHLERAGDDHTVEETGHLEEAFASALLVSIGLALLASVLAALAVSAIATGDSVTSLKRCAGLTVCLRPSRLPQLARRSAS